MFTYLTVELGSWRCFKQMASFEVLHNISCLLCTSFRYSAGYKIRQNRVRIRLGNDDGKQQLRKLTDTRDRRYISNTCKKLVFLSATWEFVFEMCGHLKNPLLPSARTPITLKNIAAIKATIVPYTGTSGNTNLVQNIQSAHENARPTTTVLKLISWSGGASSSSSRLESESSLYIEIDA